MPNVVAAGCSNMFKWLCGDIICRACSGPINYSSNIFCKCYFSHMASVINIWWALLGKLYIAGFIFNFFLHSDYLFRMEGKCIYIFCTHYFDIWHFTILHNYWKHLFLVSRWTASMLCYSFHVKLIFLNVSYLWKCVAVVWISMVYICHPLTATWKWCQCRTGNIPSHQGYPHSLLNCSDNTLEMKTSIFSYAFCCTEEDDTILAYFLANLLTGTNTNLLCSFKKPKKGSFSRPWYSTENASFVNIKSLTHCNIFFPQPYFMWQCMNCFGFELWNYIHIRKSLTNGTLYFLCFCFSFSLWLPLSKNDVISFPFVMARRASKEQMNKQTKLNLDFVFVHA